MIELLRRLFKITHPITRNAARACILLNLFAWPGLGSVLAERFSGWFQMLLSMSGVLMVIAGFFQFTTMIWEETRYPTWQDRFVWLALGGATAFACAWIWSLITSLSIFKKAVPAATPPKMKGPPPL